MRGSIELHKKCLKSKKNYARRLKKDMQRQADKIQKLEKSIKIYALQVETAEKTGLKKFSRTTKLSWKYRFEKKH